GSDPAFAALAGRADVHIDTRWVPEQEIKSIFERVDIVVTPYVDASQSGIIPLAYELGLPVVATPVGGLPEQVVDGMTGVLVSNVSGPALAAGISRLLADPLLYRRCSQGAIDVS